MRLAGIDIGSNAVRLLVADITADDRGGIKNYRKVKLYRVPVRLGIDAFTAKAISTKNAGKLIKAMNIFRELMDIYEVEDYKAVATSAMREAKNSEPIIKQIQQEAQIDISIIEGNQEATLILSNQAILANLLDPRFSHLYVDVGGGSTEISLIRENQVLNSKSFKIGTVRLFNNMVTDEVWQKLENWLISKVKNKLPLSIIGSGGNINSIFKRSGNLPFEPLMYETLVKEKNLLAALTLEDRIYLQDMNRDRAEVIVPAMEIFIFIMEKTGIRQVVVPKIGVSDGIVRDLFLSKINTCKN